MSDCDPQELMDSAACFACLPEDQKQTLKLQLLCEIFNAGGGGGGGGVTSIIAGEAIAVDQATGAVTIDNTGVTSAIAGIGISVDSATGPVTITNSGVVAIVAGSGITVDQATGAVTISATANPAFSFSQATFSGRLTDIAQGSGANAAVILAPTGTGFFALDVPDGTSAGGNNRGNNAADLQTSRSAATQVASGSNSFTAGGRCTASGFGDIAMGYSSLASGGSAFVAGESNTASGYASTCFGNFSTASGSYSFCGGATSTASGLSSIVLAEQCTASNQYSAALGGRSHAVSGQYATCVGGRGNSATANYSTVSGGQANVAAGFYSHVSGYGGASSRAFERVHGFSGNGGIGGHQRIEVGWYTDTTNATPTVLFLDGASERYVIPANSLVQMTLKIQASRNTAGAEFAAWERRVVLKRGVAVGTVAIVGSPQVIGVDVGSNAGIPPVAWAIAIAVDVATGSLQITVTGEAAKTIRWTAIADAAELVYA